jgi:two-component system, OmpR family, sensor kinase
VTLRSRLTFALVLLTAVGLGFFGLATYRLYARSQFQRLDDQLEASAAPVAGLLVADEDRPPDAVPPRPEGKPPLLLPSGTYAELHLPNDEEIRRQLGDSSEVPDLPADVTSRHRPFTVGSESGSTTWRVQVANAPGRGRIVLAAPTTEVERSLDRLVLIEAATSVGLLLALASGAWLILRRGLSPLERMATTARAISAGDLDERVDDTDARTEVGQLGVAFNTMLDDLQRAFAERDATEQRLRQFLADASHELRTPLTSIQGFAELFRLGPDAQLDLPVILRRVEQESERMKLLVEDLLLLARLDQTRPIELAPVDLAVLAADACTDAVALDRTRPVTLASPDPVVVEGDGDHLRQAIGNLVANAVQHTPAGTPLEVAVRTEDGSGVVTVRDHGEGLSSDAVDHAFDRFWQADRARSGMGSGLGLAIVAAIADEHGGTVTAANAPEGGACFTLRLPIQGRANGSADPGID